MPQKEYLEKENYECTPKFLTEHVKGKEFNFKDFFASRITYYPGAGTDWHAIETFGISHSCHCFIYSDYMIPKQDYINVLYNNGINGYSVNDIIEFDVNKVFKNYKPKNLSEAEISLIKENSKNLPYGFVTILSKKLDFDEQAPSNIAVMFLGIDSILAYDMIFASGVAKNLFACLIQDHGFGGGYDSFGATGIMYKIAERSNIFPKLILMVDKPDATERNKLWPNYAKIVNVDGSYGGMHNNHRFLFKHNI